MREGHRRYAGTDPGDEYQRVLAHEGTGDATNPSAYQRPLGDFVDPSRGSSIIHLVNVVTERTGLDAATWRFDRLASMARTLEDVPRSALQ